MSDTIEVVIPEVEKERPEQQIMAINVAHKTLFLEWGAVSAATLTEMRTLPIGTVYSLDFHLKSGQTVTLSPVLGQEAQQAINHVFGKKAVEAEEVEVDDSYGEASS